MRDALDEVTHELPTFPPVPRVSAKPPRVNARDRRELCGYLAPKDCDTCRNCRHVVATTHAPDTPFENETHACGRHRFSVLLGSTCDVFVSRKR